MLSKPGIWCLLLNGNKQYVLVWLLEGTLWLISQSCSKAMGVYVDGTEIQCYVSQRADNED